MTICITTAGINSETGGIATFTGYLASSLTRAGHGVVVLRVDYSSPKNAEDDVYTEERTTTITLKKSYHGHYTYWKQFFKPGGLDPASWLATGMAMRDWLMNNHSAFKIDIIEVSDYGGTAVFLCDPSLPPVAITGHGSLTQLAPYQFDQQKEETKIIRNLEMLSFKNADGIIAHSPLNRNSLRELTNRVIYLAPMPWTQSQPMTPETAPVIGKIVVVGGLQPVKGIYEMINATRLLRERRQTVQVNWIGPDTWLAPGYQNMSAWLSRKYPDLWNKVFYWKGLHTASVTKNEIATASILVIPSRFDTFSYVAIEAAAAGRPIIMTSGTGASYLFTHGVDAWILPSNDPTLLADAITLLLSDLKLCQHLGDNAKKKVTDYFNKTNVASERAGIYEKIVADRKQQGVKPPTSLMYLEQFRKPWRKYYYCIRGALKKLVMGRK